MKNKRLISLVLIITCLICPTGQNDAALSPKYKSVADTAAPAEEPNGFHIKSADDCSLSFYETVTWGQQKYVIKKDNLYCIDIPTNNSKLMKKNCDTSYGWWLVQNHLIYSATVKYDILLYSLNLDTGQEDSYHMAALDKSKSTASLAYVTGIDAENGYIYLTRNNKIICLSLEMKETARCSIKGAGEIIDVLWGQTTYIADRSKLYRGNMEQGFSPIDSLPQESLFVDLLGAYGDYIYGVNIYPAYAGTTTKQFFQMSLKNNRKKVFNKKDYATQYQMIDNRLFCDGGLYGNTKTICYTFHENGSVTKTTYKVPFYATDGQYIYYIVNGRHSTQRVASYCLADGSKECLGRLD